VPSALAQTTLTQIQDTVFNTDGSLFNGTLLVTWTGTPGQSGGLATPSNVSVTIYNGALSITLVPSTTSPGSAPYTAVFASSNGLVTWTETWQVPPASSPLTLSEVNVTASTPSAAQIPISQVIGLTSNLDAFNGSLISLTGEFNILNSTVGGLTTSNSSIGSTVSSLSTTVTGLSNAVTNLTAQVNSLSVGNGSSTITTAFFDAEVPSGAANGINTTFTLANTPVSSSALALYLNGLLLTNGVDYMLNGTNVTFASTAVPQSGDKLQAFYRVAGTSVTPAFLDGVIPVGAINGSNMTFNLMSAPLPALSLRLYKNGDLMLQGVDYTLSGTTITFTSISVTPLTGDSLAAFYRVTP
jgi:hypothetical protein